MVMATTQTFTLIYVICVLGASGWTISSNDEDQTKKEHMSPTLHYLNTRHNSNTDRYNLGDVFTPKIEMADNDIGKYGGSDGQVDSNCKVSGVSFYRHFDEAVRNVTRGVRKDNLEEECKCTEGEFIFCNCSSLNLHRVPSYLREDVNGLDLSFNLIRDLDGAPFQNYTKLQYLSLRNNSIDRLSLHSFLGLKQLRVLDLKCNNMPMASGTYPIGVFKELLSLIALRINRNGNDSQIPGLFYPDEALADLKTLRFLSMDGLSNKNFGEGFGKLVNLETLSLSGYHDGHCKLVGLTNQTFQNLTQLKMLNASDCYLDKNYIDSNSFQPLENLHTLDLTWNEDMTIKKLAEVLGNLNHSGMKELFVRRVEWRFSPGTTVWKEYAINLPRNLSCLVASGNSINCLDDGVFDALPSTLRYLDFSGNKLTFGSYLQKLDKLQSLEFLLLNGPEYTFNIPKTFQFNKSAIKYQYKDEPKRELLYSPSQEWLYSPTQERICPPPGENESNIKLRLPPLLRVLKMKYAGLWYDLTELNICPNNSLEELDLSYNYFPKLIGPFRGFRRLKKLNMYMCQIKSMSSDFFENFTALEHLDLYGNLVGMGSSMLQQPFRALKNLTYLNLNFNAILRLGSDTFHGLSELKELHIAFNTFYEFYTDISNLTNLEVLNFRNTSIHTLSSATLNHINLLPNISVQLSGTPLYCDCSNLHFLNWMSKNRHDVIAKNSELICVLKNRASLKVTWNEFLTEVRIIRRECASNYWLFLVVLGVTLLVIVLVTGSVMYRFRWRLRYLYYGVHLWITSKTREGKDNNKQFSFDVFISYANEDLNFVINKVCPELHRRGLTTCIHSRDFKAGENIITNIIRAVKVSKKTLVVLTNDFISSKWCRAEFQMAKEEAVISGRKILMFLIADKIPKNNMGLELLTYIQQNTYIPYHGVVDNSEPNPDGQDEEEEEEEEKPTCTKEMKMWDKLARDIQD